MTSKSETTPRGDRLWAIKHPLGVVDHGTLQWTRRDTVAAWCAATTETWAAARKRGVRVVRVRLIEEPAT
jgi:hypothetical protein